MATVNAVGNSLTGSTGSGAFAGATSPVFATPSLGVVTATSIAYSNYATGGMIGTSTNNDAAASYVGQIGYVEVLQASAVSLTTAVNADVTSLSLAAGDWDVDATICFLPANTTVVSSGRAALSSTSATLGASNLSCFISAGGSSTITGNGTAIIGMEVPTQRFSLSGTTTIYLCAVSGFTISTNAAFGFIYARKVR